MSSVAWPQLAYLLFGVNFFQSLPFAVRRKIVVYRFLDVPKIALQPLLAHALLPLGNEPSFPLLISTSVLRLVVVGRTCFAGTSCCALLASAGELSLGTVP